MKFRMYAVFLVFTCLSLLLFHPSVSHAEKELLAEQETFDTMPGPGQGRCPDIPSILAVSQKCMDECLYDSQRIAMGSEVIRAICRCSCAVDEGIRLLDSAAGRQRNTILNFLCAEQDPRTVMPLVGALETDLHERTGIWAQIIPALGQSGDKRAVPVLIRALTLNDEYWLGREMSATALGDIGDPAAIPVLLGASFRGDTREAAVAALSRFDDPRVVSVLLSALDPKEEADVRDAAIQGLEFQGNDALPLLIETFTAWNPEYPETEKRIILCHLLGKNGNRRALDALRSSLSDPDQAVRRCAARYVHP